MMDIDVIGIRIIHDVINIIMGQIIHTMKINTMADDTKKSVSIERIDQYIISMMIDILIEVGER